MILAMIRPGKRYLVGKSWSEIEDQVWEKPDNNTYFFKKSHAYSYAMATIVQLNKIVIDVTQLNSTSFNSFIYYILNTCYWSKLYFNIFIIKSSKTLKDAFERKNIT